jgi:hypothetical protein
VLDCEAQDAKRARHLDSLATRGFYAAPIIHQQQVGMQLYSQSDSLSLSGAKTVDRIGQRGVLDFQPLRRSQDPTAHHSGRVGIAQLGFHGGRQNHFLEHCRKNIDGADREQIIDRAGVGYDQLHLVKTLNAGGLRLRGGGRRRYSRRS